MEGFLRSTQPHLSSQGYGTKVWDVVGVRDPPKVTAERQRGQAVLLGLLFPSQRSRLSAPLFPARLSGLGFQLGSGWW